MTDENNKHYDWIIVGGNFCGMMAAYSLHRAGASVAIVESGPKLGGFMAPIPWAGMMLDKGPQYFDNFEAADKDLLEDILDTDLLVNIGFSYATYNKGCLNTDYAIPDWRTEGEDFTDNVFRDVMRNISNGAATEAPASFADLLDREGPTLAPRLHALAKKFVLTDAAELSPGATLVASFLGRKVLFDADVSMRLKRLPELDARLAAPKARVDDTRYNLYPQGRNLDSVRARMVERLEAVGVAIFTEAPVSSIQPDGDGVKVECGASLQGDRALMVLNIRDCEPIFRDPVELVDLSVFVPEIFYVFKTPRSEHLPANYVQDYDLNHAVTRVTNMGNYMGPVEDGDEAVICAEVPAWRDSEQWQNAQGGIEPVWNELEEIGAVKTRYSEAAAMPVPVTFRLARVGFEASVDRLSAQIAETFGERVVIPNPHILTRKQGLDALREAGIIQ